jgi:hypothetical protein
MSENSEGTPSFEIAGQMKTCVDHGCHIQVPVKKICMLNRNMFEKLSGMLEVNTKQNREHSTARPPGKFEEEHLKNVQKRRKKSRSPRACRRLLNCWDKSWQVLPHPLRKTQVQHLDHPQGREALLLKRVNRASRNKKRKISACAYDNYTSQDCDLLMWPRKLGTFILQFPATHKESLELSICIRYGCSRASGRTRKKSRQKSGQKELAR